MERSDTVRIYEIELYGKKTTVTPPAPEVSITIDPTEMTVNSNPGQKGQFTAIAHRHRRYDRNLPQVDGNN